MLIGLGDIGAGYAFDQRKADHFEFATHAQVLDKHPGFEWVAAIDGDPSRVSRVREMWEVPHVGTTLDDLPNDLELDVAVIATPPSFRTDVFDVLPEIRGVMVEKPLGTDLDAATAFVDRCREGGVLAQTNLWRRGDETCRKLAEGGLTTKVGTLQLAWCVYGRGLRNNGVHVVDLIRMLCGEIDSARALPEHANSSSQVLPAGDVDASFVLTTIDGVKVMAAPVDFAHYREVSFEFWGSEGMLALRHEGLELRRSARRPHRAMEEASEVVESDTREISSPGKAMYELYSNLWEAIEDGVQLLSPASSALATEGVVDSLLRSLDEDGARMMLGRA